MEFKTTTGGETTLHLDPGEREAVIAAAAAHDVTDINTVMKHFSRRRSENPLAGFEEVLAIAFPPPPKKTAGVARRPLKVDPLDETDEIMKRINRAMSEASSAQIGAYLLVAWATVNQTRVLAAKLDALVEGEKDV